MGLLNLARQILGGLTTLSAKLAETQKVIDEQKILAAKLLINQHKRQAYENIQDAEFKVFSQFGEDGIIQYLIHNVAPLSHTFIEFGVEDYREANTRFLLINDNWQGLVIDGSVPNVEAIKQDGIYWQHDLTAVQQFITAENINATIRGAGFTGEIGILSIDIDGNDYWVWEAIDVVSPAIIIVEYNSVFGRERAVTIPYDPSFNRTKAHPSNLYFGCSLRALDLLAGRKGYIFVGSNSAGNSAYFVRRDKVGKMKPLGVEAGYVESRFRESRDAQGRLTYLSGDARRRAIKEMPVLDLEENKVGKLGENERGIVSS